MLKNQDMLAGINNLQIASAIYSERDINKAQVCDKYYSKVKHMKINMIYILKLNLVHPLYIVIYWLSVK